MINKLNFGCGPKIIDGWINCDIEKHDGAVQIDLRKRLTFENETVECIFSEHFIEHLEQNDFKSLLKECFRILKKGKTIRLATPDLDVHIKAALGEWEKLPWVTRRKQEIHTKAEMLNMLFHGWGHKFIFDFETLKNYLQEAGFQRIEKKRMRKSENPLLNGLETRDGDDLVIEAIKN